MRERTLATALLSTPDVLTAVLPPGRPLHDAAELADALDSRADTFAACARPENGWGEDRDLLRSAAHALRRLGQDERP